MFSKASIKSFVYDIIDVFMFPNEEIKQFYQKIQHYQMFDRTKFDRYG